MRLSRGHLGGATVSALVDGQLDREAAEQAWTHVLGCQDCRERVVQEGRVKTELARLGGGQPSPRLLGRLHSLDGAGSPAVDEGWQGAWATVTEIEHRAAERRRAGLAAIGVGTVSAAVLGFASLSGTTLGIGQGPASTPTASLSRPGATPVPTTAVIAPTAAAHGRLPLARRTGHQRLAATLGSAR